MTDQEELAYWKLRAKRLSLENERLQKDAKRYRWLRDQDGAFSTFTALYYNTTTVEELELAIDAAMESQP